VLHGDNHPSCCSHTSESIELAARLFNYLWTDSIKLSLYYEATSRSGSRQVLCILWYLMIYCWVRESPLLDRVLSQINLFHIWELSFFKVGLHLLPCTPICRKWSLPLRLPEWHIECIFHLSVCMLLLILNLIPLILAPTYRLSRENWREWNYFVEQ
jgi:hypothetical protein